jgi:hypothetical protein
MVRVDSIGTGAAYMGDGSLGILAYNVRFNRLIIGDVHAVCICSDP